MIKASEFCVSFFDGTHKSPKPTKEGYKLLTSKNILNGYIDSSDAYFISEQDYNSINERSKIYKWDILFSMIGTVGNICLITEEKLDFAIKNMGVFSTRNEEKAKWLYFYLKSPIVKRKIQNQLNGAVQKFLPLGWLRNLELPEYKEDHKRIVDLLWSIEEKINKNNSINLELETMTKTIYDYWFLQFEFPNEKRMPYKSSGGKMVWNEELKREIPDGWGAFDFTNTEICQMIQPGVKLFSLKNYLATSNVNNEYMNDGNWIEYNNRETRANMQPVEYSIWFAKMKNSIKHISIPFNSDWFTQKYILSTGFVGLSCNEFSFAYVHSIVNSNNFEKRKDSLAHGATQEAINNEDLKNMKFVLPNKTILNAFALIINPFLELKFKVLFGR